MKTEWASCSTWGRICISTELLKGPAAFREVVIVHELLHLNVPNHGKLFKSLMTAYVPDWQARKAGRQIVSVEETAKVRFSARISGQ